MCGFQLDRPHWTKKYLVQRTFTRFRARFRVSESWFRESTFNCTEQGHLLRFRRCRKSAVWLLKLQEQIVRCRKVP